MVASLYLGIRLHEKPYERLKLSDIDLQSKKFSDLKVDTEKLLNHSAENLGKRKKKYTYYDKQRNALFNCMVLS